jgi:hypothetical protein
MKALRSTMVGYLSVRGARLVSRFVHGFVPAFLMLICAVTSPRVVRAVTRYDMKLRPKQRGRRRDRRVVEQNPWEQSIPSQGVGCATKLKAGPRGALPTRVVLSAGEPLVEHCQSRRPER